MDAKSYSERKSLLRLRRVFFVELPFGPRRRPRADDSDFVVIFGMRYY